MKGGGVVRRRGEKIGKIREGGKERGKILVYRPWYFGVHRVIIMCCVSQCYTIIDW